MDEEKKEPEKEAKPNTNESSHSGEAEHKNDLPTNQKTSISANNKKTDQIKDIENYTSEFIGPLPTDNQTTNSSEGGYNPHKDVKIDNVDVIADDHPLAAELDRKAAEAAPHGEENHENKEHEEKHDGDHGNHPVIIKRIKKVHKGGHHGGSWKIAYADFVTAMMAFFLIMWILALLNKSQLKSVSLYFKDPKEAGQVDKGTHQFKEDVKSYFLDKGDLKSKDRKKDENKDKDKNKEKKKEDKKIMIQEKQIPIEMQMQAAEELKRKFEQELKNNPKLQQFKNNLNFIVTADGLKIIIKDLNNKPMFTTGKTDFENYASSVLNWLGEELAKHPNQVEIIGHTDSIPYQGPNYSNWELSADRANATRRALIKSGVDPDKFLRVSGRSDTDLLDKEHSTNPSNRRIEIIVLTDDAKKRLTETSDTIGREINAEAAASEETSPVTNAQPIFNSPKPRPANVTIPQETPSPAAPQQPTTSGKTPIPATIAKPNAAASATKPQAPATIAKPQGPTSSVKPLVPPAIAKPKAAASVTKPQVPATIAKPQGPTSSVKSPVSPTMAKPQVPATIAKPQASTSSVKPQTPAIIAKPQTPSATTKPQESSTKMKPQIPATIAKPQQSST